MVRTDWPRDSGSAARQQRFDRREQHVRGERLLKEGGAGRLRGEVSGAIWAVAANEEQGRPGKRSFRRRRNSIPLSPAMTSR